MPISNQNEVIGSGKLYVALLDPVTQRPKGGYRYIGNTTALSAAQTQNRVQLWDADHGKRFVRRSANISTEMTLTATTSNLDEDNIAFIFGAEASSTVTQAAITSATEAIEGIVLGRWYVLGETPSSPTGVRGMTSAVPTVASLTLEEDVDFKVDLPKGKIMFLDGGALTGGENASVAYAAGAATFTRVVPGNKTVTVAVRFESQNLVGDDHVWKWAYAEVSTDGELVLKGEDFATADLTFNIMMPEDGYMMTRDGYPHAL